MQMYALPNTIVYYRFRLTALGAVDLTPLGAKPKKAGHDQQKKRTHPTKKHPTKKNTQRRELLSPRTQNTLETPVGIHILRILH
jgi:hypothetical protein